MPSALLFFLASVLAASAFAKDNMQADDQEQAICRYSSPSIYVVDEGKLRYLRFGSLEGSDQSILDLENPNRLTMPYLRPAALAAEVVGHFRNALIIGLGGGGFTRYLRRRFPALIIDAVEIDPEVVMVAKRFFGISEDKYLNIHLVDGAAYMEELSISPVGRYDLIFLDAYDGDRIPEPLTTERFLTNVRKQLREQALVIANVGKEDLNTYRLRFGRIFPECFQLRAWQDANVIFVGSKAKLPSRQEVIRKANSLDTRLVSGFLYSTIARTWKHCQ
jgi:spermidine synthase